MLVMKRSRCACPYGSYTFEITCLMLRAFMLLLTCTPPPKHLQEPPHGTFARASEEVLKQRKIVRARRGPTSGTGAQPNPFANIHLAPTGTTTTASNPFAGISLVPAQPPAALDTQNQTSAPKEKNADTEEEERSGNAAQKADEEEGAEAKDVKEDAPPKPKPFETSGGFGALATGTTRGFGGFGGFGALASSGTAPGGFGSLGKC